MQEIKIISGAIMIISFAGVLLGASIAIGYNFFKNKTKKVCDLCFREIKAINAMVNKKKVFFDQEIVICSAIKTGDGLIIRGHRHCDCFHNFSERPNPSLKVYRESLAMTEQGFITSRNRFVGREEALKIQILAGKKSNDPHGYRGEILYSEDLY